MIKAVKNRGLELKKMEINVTVKDVRFDMNISKMDKNK